MYNVDIISKNAVYYLPVDSILPNPYQPRKDLREIKSLVNSVKQYGVIEPITVRKIGRSYELVNGQRRLKAVKLAGFDEIPSIIVEVSDRDSAVISILENLERKELGCFEKAEAYKTIMEDFDHTPEELAQLLCVSREDIFNQLQLLKLKGSVKKSILENNAEECAVAICQLEKEENQIELLDKINSQGLGVKGACKIIEELKNGNSSRVKVKKYFKDIRLFINTVKQATEIMCQAGKQTSYTVEHKGDEYEIKILIKE